MFWKKFFGRRARQVSLPLLLNRGHLKLEPLEDRTAPAIYLGYNSDDNPVLFGVGENKNNGTFSILGFNRHRSTLDGLLPSENLFPTVNETLVDNTFGNKGPFDLFNFNGLVRMSHGNGTVSPDFRSITYPYQVTRDGSKAFNFNDTVKLDLVGKGDLLIKEKSQADTEFIGQNVYSTDGPGSQVITRDIQPGQRLFFTVRPENDFPLLNFIQNDFPTLFPIGAVAEYRTIYTGSGPTDWLLRAEGSNPNSNGFPLTNLGAGFGPLLPQFFDQPIFVQAPLNAKPGDTFVVEVKMTRLDTDFEITALANEVFDTVQIVLKVPLQQDMQVRREFDGESFVGVGVTEGEPTDLQTVQLTALPNLTSNFEVRFEHKGTQAKTFNFRREVTGLDGFQAKYFFQNSEVTEAVNAGTFITPSIEPGGAVKLQVRIGAPANLAGINQNAVIIKAFEDTTATAPLDGVRVVASTDLIVNTEKDLEDDNLGDGIDSDRNDPGLQLSLRDAIRIANLIPGFQRITFDLPGSVKIATEAPLPTITGPVEIDGTTQGSGFVELVGQNGLDPQDGFQLAAGSDGSTIRGFFIHSFFGDAIRIENSGGHKIARNFLGLKPNDSDSVEGVRNLGDGVRINNGSNIAITQNVVSGNLGNGVSIRGANSKANEVIDNLIGTTIDGLRPLGNKGHGVFIENGSNNSIRVNTIAANEGDGIRIAGPQAKSNQVLKNFIGLSNDGLANLPLMGNLGNGLFLGAGAAGNIIGLPDNGNRINQNQRFGVAIVDANTKDNVVSANKIGSDELASGPGNLLGGVFINDSPDNQIGGNAPELGNLISGNGSLRPVEEGRSHGILIRGANATDTFILANLIGVNNSGTVPAANTGSGIQIEGASGTTIGNAVEGSGNIISGNLLHGIHIVAGGNHRVIGNRIGTTQGGTGLVPNGKSLTGVVTAGGGDGVRIENSQGNFIGEDTQLSGNTIAGNAAAGIRIVGELDFNGVSSSRDNTIRSNRIEKNDGSGIALVDAAQTTIGGATDSVGVVVGNSISGNKSFGIRIESSAADFRMNNVIQGNLIGAVGGNDTPNLGAGLSLNNASGNHIGGGTGDILNGRPLEGNVIGGNINGIGDPFGPNFKFGHGIEIAGGNFNVVQGNFIGFQPDGIAAADNQADGIFLTGNASENIIGQTRTNGTVAGIGNLIGNSVSGVDFEGRDVVRNQIRGNAIGFGLNPALGGNLFGIVISRGRFNLIDENSLIGNTDMGILISGSAAPEEGVNNIIIRNQIGFSFDGATQSREGIVISGSSHNVIGANGPFNLNNFGPGHPEGNRIVAAKTAVKIIANPITTDTATENLIGGNFIADSAIGVHVFGGKAQHNVIIGNRIDAIASAGVKFTDGASFNIVGQDSTPNPNQPGHNVISQTGIGVEVDTANTIGILGNNFFGNGVNIQHTAAGDVALAPVIENIFTSPDFEFTSVEGQVNGGAGQPHLLQFFLVNDSASGPASFQFLGQRRFTPNGDNAGRFRFVLGRTVNPTFRVVATSSRISEFGGAERFNTSNFSAPANIQLFTDDGDGVPDAIEELLNPGSANDPALVTVPIFSPDNPVAEVTELPSFKFTASSSGSSFREVEVLKTELLGNLPPKVKVEALFGLKQVNIAGIGEFEIEVPSRVDEGMLVRKLLLLNPPVRDDGSLNFKFLDVDRNTGKLEFSLVIFDGLAGDQLRVRFSVADGGKGDRDGVVNGIIVDPLVFFTAPETDLSVTVLAPPSVTVGDNATVTVRAANNGLDLADRVESTLVLPPGFDFVSASDDGRFDPATRTVRFVLGDLPGGATVDRTVVLRSIASGNLPLKGEVLPLGFIGDPRDDNNSFETTVASGGQTGLITVQRLGNELRINGDARDNDVAVAFRQGKVIVSSSNSLLNASANPLVFSGIKKVFLKTEDGDDTVSISGNLGTNAQVSLDAGSGTDRLISAGNVHQTLSNGRLLLSTGKGNQSPQNGRRNARQAITLAGFETATLQGGSGNNRLDARAFTGSVRLEGDGGDDTLIGGSADDTFSGGSGFDTVVETANGNMTLSDERLIARGTDTLIGIEHVQMIGGSGDNRFIISEFTGQATVNGAGGTDLVQFLQDADSVLTNTLLTSSHGVKIVLVGIEEVHLEGGAGDNRLDASRSSLLVTLIGNDGNDELIGGSANDFLFGGQGDDVLRGNHGQDELDGGPGRNILDPGPGEDGVMDFGNRKRRQSGGGSVQ